MAWETPEGYRWITVHGKRVMIKDKSFPYTLEHDNYGSSGNWTDNRDPEVNEFVTDMELFARKREKQIEAFEEESKRLNEEERRRDEYKKQQERKSRRQAMKQQYNLGDTIKVNGKSYKVQSVITHAETGKLLGYMVYDPQNVAYGIDRFGEISEWSKTRWV